MKRKVYISLFLFLGMLSAAVQVLGQKSGSVGEGIITMTIAKNVGEQIYLNVIADGDFTIEGVEEQPQQGLNDYTITNQQIVIRGNVTALDCYGNQLTALDVSNNTALTKLVCVWNQLTNLNVSGCTALTSLNCRYNQLTALDVSSCTALKTLTCDNNQLTNLNVSGCTALKTLTCYKNQLTNLNVSGCTALAEFYCQNNQLTKLDVSGCTALTKLDCYGNQLSVLDVSSCTALKTLTCYKNQLTALDVSRNTALTKLDCSGNQIKGEEMTHLVNGLPDRTGKDVGTFIVVQEPGLEGNICLKSDVAIAKGKNWNVMKKDDITHDQSNYEGIYVISFTTAKAVGEKIALYMYYSYDPPTLSGLTGTPERGKWITYTLTAQEVSIIGDVTFLQCSYNQLTALDVSQNPALTTINCTGNQLTELDVSQNPALTTIDCTGNQLTELDVSQNTALRRLNCYGNQLTALDVSRNTALKELICGDNPLTALDVSRNTALIELRCQNKQLTNLDVSGCTALTRLECEKSQLKTLRLSGCAALTTLECHNNRLTNLDVSSCTALTWLDCTGNQLTTLDVFKNTALTELYCSNNQLTELDLTKNTALTNLSCNGNQLTELDLSKNTALESLYCVQNQLKVLALSKNTALNELLCHDNQIKGEEMTRLVKSLPDLTGEEAGFFAVVQEPSAEGNICLKSDVAIAARNNWRTQKYHTIDKYYSPYEGKDPISFVVTFTQEGEGTIEIFGAANLNAVESGTELVVLATPADGYELKALTANGTDILATKKFVVTAATEVKATFTKKTAADVVESGALRLYPNPASTYVNVKGAKADALVRLYDANGTLLYEARTNADGTLQIDLSAYAEGVYLLRVGDDAQRLLIQR